MVSWVQIVHGEQIGLVNYLVQVFLYGEREGVPCVTVILW